MGPYQEEQTIRSVDGLAKLDQLGCDTYGIKNGRQMKPEMKEDYKEDYKQME